MSYQTSSETRAVLMDLIEKAKKATPGLWAHQPYTDTVWVTDDDLIAETHDCVDDAAYIAACSPDALLHLLALALKGLDAEAEREKLFKTTAPWFDESEENR